MPRIIQPGLYIISNEKEKKVYIGSSIDLKQRVQKHKSELVNNAISTYNLLYINIIIIVSVISINKLESNISRYHAMFNKQTILQNHMI